MQACPICVREVIDTQWETAVGMCMACAGTYGVMPLLPARRPARPCDRCNGMRFIRAVPREIAPANLGLDVNRQLAAPMRVTFPVEIDKGWISQSAKDIDPQQAFGSLEMYICKKCGFVEWYCNDPERIPVGPQYMTEDIDYGPSDTPYRG